MNATDYLTEVSRKTIDNEILKTLPTLNIKI